MKIAFIGLGVMGGPMAANLVRAGYDVTCVDLNREKVAALEELGAVAAASAGQAARTADLVMTSLPGPHQVRALGLAEDGIIASMPDGAAWVDLSTNNRDVGQDLLKASMAKGTRLMDAPISGGSEGAEAGTLTVLVGGEAADFQALRPVFEVIGDKIEHLGPHGAGYAAKIAQVVLCYVHTLALSEALILGVKGGVSADKMLDIIQGSTGTSYVSKRYGSHILNGDYDPSFTLELALKDMRLARELADSVGITLPLCDRTTETYATACEAFGGARNHLMAVKVLEDDTGTPLRAG